MFTLILIIYASSSITTVEGFKSAESCSVALHSVIDMVRSKGDYRINGTCVEK